jgi:hypothetical protein
VKAVGRVKGHQFTEDVKLSQSVNFTKRGDIRIRIIPLNSEAVIVNILPKKVDIEKIHYKFDAGGIVRVTDDGDWHLDLSQL